MKTNIVRYIFLGSLILSSISFNSISAYADEANITMTVGATNSTEDPKENVTIRQDFPKEITKADILDTGGLNFGYDEERAIYYLFTSVNLEPKESKNFKVIIRDVWKINESDVDFLKGQVDQRLESVQGGEHYNQCKDFAEKISADLENIKTSQAAEKSDISKKIEIFRVNHQTLRDIRQKISVVDDFIKEAERFADLKSENRQIKFLIEAKNPSTTESVEEAKITRYLPKGIQPQDIAETPGFEVKFDPEKYLYYVVGTVNFEPGEKKTFNILMTDIWHISETKLDSLQESGDALVLKLVNTDYEKISAFLILEIKKYISEIKESQKLAVTPEDKVAIYTENLKRLDAIKQAIEQLRGMVEAAEKAKSKSLKEIVKSVTPDVATTWKIIYAAILFLFIISVFFYILWWGQVKIKQGQKTQELEVKETPKKKE